MKLFEKQNILLILFSLSLQFAQAQKEGFFYENQINPGTSVYIMTNQVVIENDSATFSWGDIIEEKQPALYKATFWAVDSIVYDKMDSVPFLESMSNQEGNWLMFVHGAGKTFQRAVWRAFDIAHFQHINVIAYSWPAADPRDMSFKGFGNQLAKYQQSTPLFKASLDLVQNFKHHYMHKDQSLNLILHSMGNMLLEDLVNKDLTSDYAPLLFDNVIINAASVKEENHKQWIEKLHFQKRIYITMNKGDVNLKGVRAFLKQGIQLGQKINSPPAENAIYINFTKAIGFKLPPGKSHTYFIAETAEKHEEIYNFYQQILNGKEVDLSNSNRFKARKDGVGYTFLLD